MADGGSGSQVVKAISEVVKQPVAEVKDLGRIAAESITGNYSQPQDPNQVAQKKSAEQQRRNWAMWVIDQAKKVQDAQLRFRQQQMQTDQAKAAEEQRSTQVKQIRLKEEQKKKENLALKQAQRTRELKTGGG